MKGHQGTLWGVRNAPYVNRSVGSEVHGFVQMHLPCKF